MKTKWFCLGSLLVTAFSVSGCGEQFLDAYPYQPYSESGRTVKGKITVQPEEGVDLIGKSRYVVWLNWEKSFYESIDSRDVINACVKFLRARDIWKQPKEISISYDARYPWLDNDLTISIFREYFGKNLGFQNIMTIVCLEPVVVIMVHGQIQYWERAFEYYPDNEESNQDNAFIVLDRGFAYGTRMPYDPEPKWFSPDLDISPCPVEMLSKSEGRIPVPWGSLILTREDDQWLVTTRTE